MLETTFGELQECEFIIKSFLSLMIDNIFFLNS